MGMFDKIKQAATELTETALAEPKKAYVDDAKSPFVGFETNANGDVIGLAPCGPHVAIFAGTGVGKSRKLLVPQIIMWDGPVCAVSAKSDLAEYAAAHRARRRGGPQYMMDLTGQADWSKLPEDMIPLANDPCAMLTPDADGSTDDSALDLATMLLQLGQLAMGGGKGSGGGDAALWQQLALGTLACLLQAGAGYPDPETDEWVDGGGIDWVRRAALNPGGDESEEVDLDTPSWDTAALRGSLIDSAHVDELNATKVMEPKQRDSAGINMRAALGNWSKRSVRGHRDSKAFTPDLLADPTATFYLVSPDTGGGASAAAAVIESLVSYWKLNSIRKGLPKIAMIIDESPQICPLPALDKHIGVMRSYGMHFVVAAQHSSQFDLRFGEAMTKVLMNIFPSILIGVGAIEEDIIKRAAWAEPPTERQVASTDANGRKSYSADKVETYHAAELLPRDEGEARLLKRGLAGMKVKLVDFSEM